MNIERKWDGSPTIVKDKIEDGCIFENTLVGFGTIIIDKDFIDEMNQIDEKVKSDKKLISLLTNINNEVKNYFYSSDGNDKSRKQAYDDNRVVDEEGCIIGTKLSSLKGKNVALCSEKSIGSYLVLKRLYETGAITREPSLVLSSMETTNSNPGPHAFVLLDKECEDPTKHLLFDPENPTLVDDGSGNNVYYVGVYSLTDEEYNNLIGGKTCSPTSIYEIGTNYKEVSDKRTYGNCEKNKTL
jgi:hypothetical protein